MIATNVDRLIILSVMGEVHSPHAARSPYGVAHDGRPFVLPGTGGIAYNLRVGDTAYGWMADHVEPGVTVRNAKEEENHALNILACVGNEARVVSGDAKGEAGTVTGKHGGSEHVLVDFTPEVKEKLIHGDRILIKAWGRGLELTDFPEVKAMNLSPTLLSAMGLQEEGEKLLVPVAGIAPAELMGSGVGMASERGDYDIMTADGHALQENGLDRLRLGDIVAIRDHDNSYGRNYRKGAMTIGIVTHADCLGAGHGPGVTTLLTCPVPKMVPRLVERANIVDYLDLG